MGGDQSSWKKIAEPVWLRTWGDTALVPLMHSTYNSIVFVPEENIEEEAVVFFHLFVKTKI